MNLQTRLTCLFSLLICLSPLSAEEEKGPASSSLEVPELSGQSLVFIHPDGTALSGWNIYRILDYGPDGYCQWDLLPALGVYRSHMRDNLDASSHGGGTIHAYGVKVLRDSYGMNGKQPLVSASGYPGSVMTEARDAGMTIGIINSGHIAEPGTGCMLASVESRRQAELIAAQIVRSGAHLIMGGGEVLFLPEGKKGVHGAPGIRKDGINLIDEAKSMGYTVIYHRRDLESISADSERILGIFAAEDTYNDENEEELEARALKPYIPGTPSVGDMTEAALKWMEARKRPYFLMIEEEGTDNFSNAMNASGSFEAYRRADAAIGVARKQVAISADLTLLVAADSEAGCPELFPRGRLSDIPKGEKLRRLPGSTPTGSPLDGVEGTGTRPFISQPDQFGERHLFGVAWTDSGDHYGSVLVRAEGAGADLLPFNLDNTDIYGFVRRVIFHPSPLSP